MVAMIGKLHNQFVRHSPTAMAGMKDAAMSGLTSEMRGEAPAGGVMVGLPFTMR